MAYKRNRIPVEKDSVAEAIQKSVTAYWEDRIDEKGQKTGEQFKMRSMVFPSMLISMAQLVIGVAYGVANSKGIEEPTAKDILSIIGNTTNIFDNIQVFRSIQGFTDEWLEQSATAKDFDDVWFDFQTILSKYNEFVEKERSKTE